MGEDVVIKDLHMITDCSDVVYFQWLSCSTGTEKLSHF